MTSLFFVMLVLYVLTFLQQKYQQKATENQLSKIKEIEASVKELPREFFDYQNKYKRYTLNKQIQFEKRSSKISEKDYEYLYNVGKSIFFLIDKLKVKYPDEDIKYLVIIEGMASKDNYKSNNQLSYERALALLRLWESQGIMFESESCEIQIAGSGTGGIREYSQEDEYKNQRFLIQIVPKIGEIKFDNY